MSRVARGLSLVAGGTVSARPEVSSPANAGEGDHSTQIEWWRGRSRKEFPFTSCTGPPPPEIWRRKPTLSEIFAAHPRDGGWAGFLLAQAATDRPLLWVQDRMSILESGRIHPSGLPSQDLIHVEARDARDVLWAMEEGVRCSCLSAVIGEIWGDPKALDFTATRRLAVASERSGTPCWLVRLGGTANLSGARMRWRLASAPSLLNSLDSRAPGLPVWDAELFRARGHRPGRWSLAHEKTLFHLVAASGDRALGEDHRLIA